MYSHPLDTRRGVRDGVRGMRVAWLRHRFHRRWGSVLSRVSSATHAHTQQILSKIIECDGLMPQT